MATPAAIIQPDVGDLREVLGTVKTTLGSLDQTFQILNEQSEKISKLGPTMDHAANQIQELRHQIHKKDQKQETRVQNVRDMVQIHLKEKMAQEMAAFIDAEIRNEVALQVKDEVRDQFKDHISLSLEERVRGSREQLSKVRDALQNSEARRNNAPMETESLGDKLHIVLKPNGTPSQWWPADLRALLSYTPKTVRDLMSDYELSDCGSREKNLNRFMAHIGIRMQIVQFPVGESKE